MARPRLSRSNRLSASVLGLSLILAATGCASVPVRQPVSPEAAAAQTLIERRCAEFHDLRTLAEITMRKGDRTQRLAGVLLLRAPASTRFEALSPLGTPVLIVAGDASTLTVWEVLDDKAYRLPASPDATKRWLGLALGPDELVATLAGCALPLKDPLVVELLAPDDTSPSLRLRGKDMVQRIWFDPADGQPRAVEWTDGTPAHVTFADGAPDSVPTTLRLYTLDGKMEVRIRYQNPRLNSGFDPDLMTLTVPERVRIQDFR